MFWNDKRGIAFMIVTVIIVDVWLAMMGATVVGAGLSGLFSSSIVIAVAAFLGLLAVLEPIPLGEWSRGLTVFFGVVFGFVMAAEFQNIHFILLSAVFATPYIFPLIVPKRLHDTFPWK